MGWVKYYKNNSKAHKVLHVEVIVGIHVSTVMLAMMFPLGTAWYALGFLPVPS